MREREGNGEDNGTGIQAREGRDQGKGGRERVLERKGVKF